MNFSDLISLVYPWSDVIKHTACCCSSAVAAGALFEQVMPMVNLLATKLCKLGMVMHSDLISLAPGLISSNTACCCSSAVAAGALFEQVTPMVNLLVTKLCKLGMAMQQHAFCEADSIPRSVLASWLFRVQAVSVSVLSAATQSDTHGAADTKEVYSSATSACWSTEKLCYGLWPMVLSDFEISSSKTNMKDLAPTGSLA